MSSIKSKNTSPERVLRKALWEKGCRYRIQYGPERIDVAFPKHRVAIFVDGCFWHQCPIHSFIPLSHRDYWEPKLKRNVERAKEKDGRLQALGWLTIHIWEHDLKKPEQVGSVVNKIIELVKVRDVS
jgi:DNA mismatch endonuclease (patch repair protein)